QRAEPRRRMEQVDGLDELDELAQRFRGGEHDPLAVERPAQGAQRGDGGEEVAHAERPKGQDGVAHGQEVSSEQQTTISRISQPGGCRSAKTTARATSRGSLSFAVGAGLYCSGLSSKKPVRIPPGMRSVTPMRPAVSAASARVKPTTPNLEAQ